MSFCKRLLIITLLIAGAATTARTMGQQPNTQAIWDPKPLKEYYKKQKRKLDVATQRNNTLKEKNLKLKEILDKRYEKLEKIVGDQVNEIATTGKYSGILNLSNHSLTSDELHSIIGGIPQAFDNLTIRR